MNGQKGLATKIPENFFFLSYLVGSEPFSRSVFINRSWPYLAAICNGVFPILSQQSISAPEN